MRSDYYDEPAWIFEGIHKVTGELHQWRCRKGEIERDFKKKNKHLYKFL